MAGSYWNRSELRVSLGNAFNVKEKLGSFNKILKRVSLSARARYDNKMNSSVF